MQQHVQQFFDKYLPEALAAAKDTTIFPETIIAAAATESNWGRSQLTLQANNFFGIKAGSSWKGPTVIFRTREEKNDGSSEYINAPFRKYISAKDCFRDYVIVITKQRYVNAGVTTATTPQQQIAAIKKAGYATDSNYTNTLTSIVNQYSSYIASVFKKNPGITTGLASLLVFFCSLS